MEHITSYNASKGLRARYFALPENPRDATWTCAICGEVAPAPLNFGGVLRYGKRKCACQEREEREKQRAEQQRVFLEAQANHTYCWLGRRWSDPSLRAKTFETFDVSRQPGAFEVVQMFIEDMCGTLVLYGDYGTGKTHLLASLCNAVLTRKNITSLFAPAPILFWAIQARMQEDQGYDDLLEKAIKTRLLVIDDIDKAKWSEFREQIYYTIIDERVKAGRPIAISTNRLDALADYVGGAACSRLKIGQMPAEMVGADYREEL